MAEKTEKSLEKKIPYYNRELSWMDFNARVLEEATKRDKPKGGLDLSPEELLRELEEKAHRFMERQYSCLHRSILPALEKSGIRFLPVEEMNPAQKEYVSAYFQHVLFPVLTPLAVDGSRPFPLLANKSLNIAVALESREDKEAETMFAIVQAVFGASHGRGPGLRPVGGRDYRPPGRALRAAPHPCGLPLPGYTGLGSGN